jgi:tripartite-type tricarboxylate transporter receptor subunit TctC
MGEALRQPFVIENRPGAGGIIGSDQVAKAPADGHTLLINVSAHVINPYLYARLPHDPLTDFTPITGVASTSMQLVVSTDLPVSSIPDLVRHVRANPGRCSFASSSTGTPGHLAGELFKIANGLDAQHAPYRGSAPALTDVLSGRVTFMFDSMPSSLPMVQAGKLRALAVTSTTRVGSLPSVPTMVEAGFPEISFTNWYGMWAPKRLPAALATQIQEATAAALRRPEVKARLAGVSAEGISEPPDRFAAFCQAETERYARIIQTAGIRME